MVKGFPSKTIGNADVYFMEESKTTAFVYYNDKGFSTIILLIPDKMKEIHPSSHSDIATESE